MERERLGRVAAVALLALLTPVACAALGVGTPSASGLPPSPGSASPAARQGCGEEAPTEAFLTVTRRTGYWAVPASQPSRRHASNARVRVFVPSDNDVVDHLTSPGSSGQVTADAPPEPALAEATTETAPGPAASTPEVTPVATRHLRSR